MRIVVQQLNNVDLESVIKIWSSFLYSSIKKIQTFSDDFWNKKWLKIRIAVLLTLQTKKNQRPRIFLYTQSWSWGQVYSSLNSAQLITWGQANLGKENYVISWLHWFSKGVSWEISPAILDCNFLSFPKVNISQCLDKIACWW